MRATPTARILLAYRSRKWATAQALAELLDNSFGELRGRASAIWLQWTPKTRRLAILDNGRGMNDVADLFVIGQGANSGAGDIGLYGVGGSEALLWLADDAEVITLRSGRVARARANWAECIQRVEFPNIERRPRDATSNNCPMELLAVEHGTLIQLSIRQDLRIYPEAIQERLSRLFGVALRGGRHVTWTTFTADGPVETQLHPWDPGPLEDVITATVKLDADLSASVRAGRVDGLSLANSKLSVNFIYREIKETTAGFGRPVQGAIGDVDLSPEWLPYLTTTKDDIREDCRHLEDALMAKIAIVLAPLIEQLQRSKRAKIFRNVRINLKKRFDRGFEAIGAGDSEREVSDDELTDVTVEIDSPETEPEHPQRPRRRHQSKRAAEIHIESSTDEAIGGLLCQVVMNNANAVAFINEEHPLVAMALDAEPVNQRLLEQILIPALAKEIVEADALVTFGLLSQRAADALMQRYNGNALDVVLYLIRILTDGVVEPVEVG